MLWGIQLKECGENNHGETSVTKQGESTMSKQNQDPTVTAETLKRDNNQILLTSVSPVSFLLVCQKKPEGEIVVFNI